MGGGGDPLGGALGWWAVAESGGEPGGEEGSFADGVGDALAEFPVENDVGLFAIGDGGRVGTAVFVVGGQPSPCMGDVVSGGVDLLSELVGLGKGSAEGGEGCGVFVSGVGAVCEDLAVGDSRG